MLSKDEWENVLKKIEGNGFSIRKAIVYVNAERGVNCTYKGVWEASQEKEAKARESLQEQRRG